MEKHLITILLMSLKLSTILAAPLQFPLLQPLPGTWQQQQLALQEQMLALQQFQALQRFNALPSPLAMSPQQPFLILLPYSPSNAGKNERFTKINENDLTKNKPDNEIENGDNSDAIIIDADHDETLDDADSKGSPMRAILILPNTARFSLGEFISSIPWLPIEINVPNSISWIYDGISGIISGIGQSWPFNRPQTNEMQNENTKTLWNDLKMKKIMPIIIMPLGQPMLKIQR